MNKTDDNTVRNHIMNQKKLYKKGEDINNILEEQKKLYNGPIIEHISKLELLLVQIYTVKKTITEGRELSKFSLVENLLALLVIPFGVWSLFLLIMDYNVLPLIVCIFVYLYIYYTDKSNDKHLKELEIKEIENNCLELDIKNKIEEQKKLLL
jgi:hypothetical protein